MKYRRLQTNLNFQHPTSSSFNLNFLKFQKNTIFISH